MRWYTSLLAFLAVVVLTGLPNAYATTNRHKTNSTNLPVPTHLAASTYHSTNKITTKSKRLTTNHKPGHPQQNKKAVINHAKIVANTTADNTKTSTTSPNVQFVPTDPQKPWFIKPLVGVMKIDTPNLVFNTFNNTTVSFQNFSFKTSSTSVFGGVTIGRHINNNHFLQSIFGQTSSLEFQVMATQQKDTTTITNSAGNYVVPNIAGGGTIDTFFSNPTVSTRNRLIRGSILFRGKTNLSSKRLILSPYFGIFVQALNQDNDFSVNENNPPTLIEIKEDIRSYYTGVEAGESMNIIICPKWFFFLNPHIALAYVNSKFTGRESSPLVADISVNDSLNKFSYIASLSGGIGTYLPHVNIILKLSGGVDYYSFMPEIVNPNPSTRSAAHLVRTTAVNPFVTLSATLPF